MGDLTRNFSLREFACKDGTPVPQEYLQNIKKLAQNLQVLRDEIKEPITVTSGYRHQKYNEKVSGAKRSQHLNAKAADIKAITKTNEQLYTLIERLIAEGKMMQGGLGIYSNGTVHYDIRGTRARWDWREPS